MIKEMLTESVYFGVAISLAAYMVGVFIRKKLPFSFVNPLLISVLIIVPVLFLFDVDYAAYDKGARFLTYFLTPATVCLAVPLYKQLAVLKENAVAILVSILVGCFCHGLTIIGLIVLLRVDKSILLSLLSKSVTTAIALGVCEEAGGITGITILGTMVAGLMGAIVGPAVLKLVRIDEPVAQGLGVGAASHAIGTSKMLEVGEIQGAMSSLSIVVTGLMTVIIVPILLQFIG